MFLMLILLMSGVIKASWVRVGAKFVLGELVLMFIPLMMSILQYKELFVSKGWQLMLTIILSTAMVMLSSALTFIMVHRLQRRFYRHQIHKAQLNLKNDDNVWGFAMNIWSILCLIWTLAAYYIAKVIYVRHRKSWLNPAITVPVITLSLMIIFNISY